MLGFVIWALVGVMIETIGLYSIFIVKKYSADK